MGCRQEHLSAPRGPVSRALGSVAAPRGPHGAHGALAERAVERASSHGFLTTPPLQAKKLCKQKKSRFIDRAKAASAKEPGEPRHRSRRERGWVLRSAATSQGAVKIPGPSGVSVCADVKAGGPGSHHGLTDVTLAPTRSLISTVGYLISLGK